MKKLCLTICAVLFSASVANAGGIDNYGVNAGGVHGGIANSCDATVCYDFLQNKIPSGLTFSRTSYATQIDQLGNIVQARANAFKYSEDITQSSAWTPGNSINIVQTTEKTPGGQRNAQKIVPSTTTTGFREVQQNVSVVNGTPYTFAAYVKPAGYNFGQIVGSSGGFGTFYIEYDLSTCALTANRSVTATTVDYGVVSAGGGWCRIWATQKAVATTSSRMSFNVTDIAGRGRGGTYAGDGIKGAYLWGSQFNLGGVQTYTPSYASAVYSPRFEYDPITHAPVGLLLEGGRTNYFINSEAPATQTITVTARAYTLSFYGTGSVVLSGTATATVNGSGAYPTRTTYTFTPTAGSLTLTLSGTVSYPQLEAGDTATSYIPAYAANGVRSAESLYIVSPSWINATEGSLLTVFDIKATSPSTTSYVATLSDGTSNNVVSTTCSNSLKCSGNIITAAAQAITTGASITANTTIKDVVSYKTGANSHASNGTIETTQLFIDQTAPSGLNRLDIGARFDGTRYMNSHVRMFKYFNKAKTSDFEQKVTQ